MMRTAAILAVICWSFFTIANPCDAGEQVEFRLKNNDRITGEMLTPDRKGFYRVRVKGEVVELRHDDVYTTVPIGSAESKESVDFRSEAVQESFLEAVLEELDGRRPRGVTPDSVRIYRNALAAVTRNEWDHAIRGAELLLEREPLWADPQILRAVLHSERGETSVAVQIALRIESLFPRDAMAQRSAAKCYERAGFPHRAATVKSRVFDAEFGGDRALYERIALWWPVDPARSIEHYRSYREVDPRFSRPWCREKALMRSAELALGIEDWNGAQAAVDEFRRQFPWAVGEVDPLQGKILESRLEDAYQSGRNEESMIALSTLAELQPDRAEEWAARREGLERNFLERVRIMRSLAELRRWCSERGHLFADDASTREQIANQYQRLALDAIGDGELITAQQAWQQASRWDDQARIKDLDKRLIKVYDRVREDLELGRHQRRLATVEAIKNAYPEKREAMLRDLTAVYEVALAERASSAELRHQLAELRALFLRAPVVRAGSMARSDRPSVDRRRPESPEEGMIRPEADALRLASTAYPILNRYFPHEIGTRWVYQTGTGAREVREIVGVTPLENGGWKIRLQVSVPGDSGGFTAFAYLVNGDLLLGHQEAPPGEIALRYPLSTEFGWDWSKGSLFYERKVARSKDPLSMSFGTFDDYVVVQGTNTIRNPGADKEYSTWTRVTYVANIGVVRVEAQDPKLERTLIEYLPPIKSAQR